MKIELTNQERQYIVNAIDSFVRQTGLANAHAGLVIFEKLKAAGAEPVKAVEADHPCEAPQVVEEAKHCAEGAG